MSEKIEFNIKKQNTKVTKTIERWVNVYADGTVGQKVYVSKKAADVKDTNRVACVKLTGTYEVKE